MNRLLAVLALAFSGFTAFGDESTLVEGAKRATAYWNSVFGRCGGQQGQGGAWYAVVPDGSIQMVPELTIQFKTEELSQEQRLNGVEFKATTSLSPGPFRWWTAKDMTAKDKTWRGWQVGEIAPPTVLLKKNGVWSQEPAPNRGFENRKPLTTCSQIPPLTHE